MLSPTVSQRRNTPNIVPLDCDSHCLFSSDVSSPIRASCAPQWAATANHEPDSWSDGGFGYGYAALRCTVCGRTDVSISVHRHIIACVSDGVAVCCGTCWLAGRKLPRKRGLGPWPWGACLVVHKPVTGGCVTLKREATDHSSWWIDESQFFFFLQCGLQYGYPGLLQAVMPGHGVCLGAPGTDAGF